MAQAQMIEGTVEEITRQLQESYVGQKLRIFIESEDEKEDFTANLPTPRLRSAAMNIYSSSCVKG